MHVSKTLLRHFVLRDATHALFEIKAFRSTSYFWAVYNIVYLCSTFAVGEFESELVWSWAVITFDVSLLTWHLRVHDLRVSHHVLRVDGATIRLPVSPWCIPLSVPLRQRWGRVSRLRIHLMEHIRMPSAVGIYSKSCYYLIEILVPRFMIFVVEESCFVSTLALVFRWPSSIYRFTIYTNSIWSGGTGTLVLPPQGIQLGNQPSWQ